MRISRLALATSLIAGTPAYAEVVAGHSPVVETARTEVCTTVDQQQLSNLPIRSSPADVLKSLPPGYDSSPEHGCLPQQPDAVNKEALAGQNAERASVGLPPFAYNPALAQLAQAWANQLVFIGTAAHSPRAGRGDVHENISQGLPDWNVGRLQYSWFKEKQYLKPGGGIFPDVSTTGNWEDVGHITQIDWALTTQIGCGVAVGRGYRYLVCDYSPAGNKDGKPFAMGAATAGGIGPATAWKQPGLLVVGDAGGAPTFASQKHQESYCSKQEQVDHLQALQSELIQNDETTAGGKARGDAIRAEIQRVKTAPIDPCQPKSNATAAATSPATSDHEETQLDPPKLPAAELVTAKEKVDAPKLPAGEVSNGKDKVEPPQLPTTEVSGGPAQVTPDEKLVQEMLKDMKSWRPQDFMRVYWQLEFKEYTELSLEKRMATDRELERDAIEKLAEARAAGADSKAAEDRLREIQQRISDAQAELNSRHK
jgi:hypothetical protein